MWDVVRCVCRGFWEAGDVFEAGRGCLELDGSRSSHNGNGNGNGSESATNSINGSESSSQKRGRENGRGRGREKKRLSPRDALEIVRERIEGEGVTNSWCSVDTKVGDLCVRIGESTRWFEGECFADEIEGALVLGGEREGRDERDGHHPGGAGAEDEIRGKIFGRF